jgi:hypothetical protein
MNTTTTRSALHTGRNAAVAAALALGLPRTFPVPGVRRPRDKKAEAVRGAAFKAEAVDFMNAHEGAHPVPPQQVSLPPSISSASSSSESTTSDSSSSSSESD